MLRAHSCMLCAASDAIRGMLRHGVALEDKKLFWREHPVEVGRFFLRLLYTGTVGTVNSNHVIEWDDAGSVGYGTDVELVKDMVQLVSTPGSNRVRDMYMTKELSPEVMFELVALWGPPD